MERAPPCPTVSAIERGASPISWRTVWLHVGNRLRHALLHAVQKSNTSFGSASQGMRGAAQEAIERSDRNPSLLAAVQLYLDHPDELVRRHALHLLQEAQRHCRSVNGTIVEHLPQILVDLYSYSSDRDRIRHEMHGSEAAAALSDTDSAVRKHALKVLMNDTTLLNGSGCATTVNAVARLLTDGEDSWVRCLALEALAKVDAAALVPFGAAIAARLEDDAPWVRRAAADTLGALPPAELSQFAERLAHRLEVDTNWQVRRNAIEALQSLDATELCRFETVIVPVQADGDELVSDAAAQVVGQMYAPGGVLEAELCAHFDGMCRNIT